MAHKKAFQLVAPFAPSGDQGKAIATLLEGLSQGVAFQTLLGVTGSGKTFTIAHVIQASQRPTIIMAPNKTLAAQLYGEMKAFFPHNAVEYFVSYYDYYQPEAYVPTTDTYIEKDASINAQIDQMRLAATKSLLEREDTIIVATVSAIYGLGDPDSYLKMVLQVAKGDPIAQHALLQRLVELQYTRNDLVLTRGFFRVRGDVIDVFPAESEKWAVRITLFDEEVESLSLIDPLTGQKQQSLARVTLYPKSHYVTPRAQVLQAVAGIRKELQSHLEALMKEGRHLERERLASRTGYDIEMLLESGYCTGIENYSRHLSGRAAGEPPPTLMDYLPANGLLVVDESHVLIPQLGGMYRGDRARKETLVMHGFRLPSAMDNRPLRFEEWEALIPQTIFVSATPGPYELERSGKPIEQIIRPTSLLDPEIVVREAHSQVADLLSEIQKRVVKKERVLATTLTKKMAEDLCDYLSDHQVKVRYLHSDIETIERVTIIRDLRLGVFDVLVGINLLREGLDIPEVSLVAILDADKEGFLRSQRALIQTIGRAARHSQGTVIMYANHMTESMKKSIAETERRRDIQKRYNEKHHITPASVKKPIVDVMEGMVGFSKKASSPSTRSKKGAVTHPVLLEIEECLRQHALDEKTIARLLKKWEVEMLACARTLAFEEAALIRDAIQAFKEQVFKKGL